MFVSKIGAGWSVSGALGSARRQALFGLALMSLGAGVLFGCAAPPPAAKMATLSSPPAPVPAVPPPRRIPLPERKPVPPPELGGPVPEGETVAMAVPQTAQNGAMPASRGDRHELIGLDQRAATRLFGTAAETSEKPPATIWRWRSATCELDLYFYLEVRSGQMRSLHYVFKGDATGQEDCLKSLSVAARS
jgi:hypothetical protein